MTYISWSPFNAPPVWIPIQRFFSQAAKHDRQPALADEINDPRLKPEPDGRIS